MFRQTDNRVVCFLIRSLERGGAERQVTLLAIELVKRGWHVSIIVFYGGGAFAAELEASGVKIVELHKTGRWDLLPFLMRLLSLLRQMRPAYLYSFMTIANLLTALMNPLFPATRVIWGIRVSDMNLARYDLLAQINGFLERKLSRLPDLIICNSVGGRDYSVSHGYPTQKLVVIQNGIDVRHFFRDPIARRQIRSEFNVKDGEILIGLSARLDPMKGYPDFLHAASLIVRLKKNVRFLCIGDGTEEYKRSMRKMAEQFGLDSCLLWAGLRSDMAAIYSALDIATSTSVFGEGFSNSVAEAMACSLPCVVTDVGDSAIIVGDSGIVVKPHQPEDLAMAWRRLVDLSDEGREALGARARSRVVENFSVKRMVDRTESTLTKLVS